MTVKSVKICEAATKMPPASELEQLESVRAQCGSSHLCNGVVNEGRSGMGLQPLPASTALVTFYNEQNLQYIYIILNIYIYIRKFSSLPCRAAQVSAKSPFLLNLQHV